MFLLAKKKGFTLIELLIVVAIIVVLSVLAVGGYSQFRKATLLNLAADSFIAQIFEQKLRTVYGERDGGGFEAVKKRLEGDTSLVQKVAEVELESVPVCRGVYLKRTNKGFMASIYSQPFINKKTFDVVKGWIYQGCGKFLADDSSISASFKGFELDKNISIIEITDDKGGELSDDLIIRFVPPFGVMEVSRDGGKKFISDFEDFSKLKIQMQYGLGDNEEFKRKIVLDLINQHAVNE